MVFKVLHNLPFPPNFLTTSVVTLSFVHQALPIWLVQISTSVPSNIYILPSRHSCPCFSSSFNFLMLWVFTSMSQTSQKRLSWPLYLNEIPSLTFCLSTKHSVFSTSCNYWLLYILTCIFIWLIHHTRNLRYLEGSPEIFAYYLQMAL